MHSTENRHNICKSCWATFADRTRVQYFTIPGPGSVPSQFWEVSANEMDGWRGYAQTHSPLMLVRVRLVDFWTTLRHSSSLGCIVAWRRPPTWQKRLQGEQKLTWLGPFSVHIIYFWIFSTLHCHTSCSVILYWWRERAPPTDPRSEDGRGMKLHFYNGCEQFLGSWYT